MSLPSIQSLKFTNSPSPCSSSPQSSSNFAQFRFQSINRSLKTTITCTQSDGQLRRPSIASPPVRPGPTPANSPPSPVASPPETPVVVGQSVVTMEFQRQKAKELQSYFKQKKVEESNQGPFFGFIAKNEISNGRFVLILTFLVKCVILDSWSIS